MRMFGIVGFTYVTGLIAASFLGLYPSLVMAGAFLFALILILLFVKGQHRVHYAAAALAAAALAAVAAFGVFSLNDVQTRRQEVLNGLTCTVEGVIVSKAETQTGKYRYQVKTTRIDCSGREDLPQSVVLSVTPPADQTYELHQTVRFTDTLQTQFSTLNPFGRPVLSIRGIKGGLLTVTGFQDSLGAKMDALKARMQAAASPYLDENTARILEGVTFGGTDGFPRELTLTFRQGGILHVFSVSGFHLAVLAQAVMSLLSALRINKKAASLATVGFTVFFMMLVGFRYAVIRAGVMTILRYLAPLFGREADSLNSLGFAALLVALIDPASVYDTGFLLSFSATLGILLCASRIKSFLTLRLRLKRRFWIGCASLLAVSVSATLFTLPVMILTFDELSLVGLLANVLLTPLFFVLLCGGFLFYLICMIPFLSFLCPFFGSVLTVCVNLVVKSLSLLVKLPYSTLPLGYDFIPLWLACTGVILGAGVLLTRRKVRVTALCITASLLLLFSGVISSLACNHNVIEVDVITSYNGTCVLVRDRSTASVVIVKGDRYLFSSLSRELFGKGVKRLTTLAVLEDSASASGCGADIVSSFPTGRAVFPEESVSMMSLAAACRRTGTLTASTRRMDLTVSPRITLSIDPDPQTGEAGAVVQTPFTRLGIGADYDALTRLEAACQLDAGITCGGGELDLYALSAPVLINALPEQLHLYTDKQYCAPGQQSIVRLLIRDASFTLKPQ